jgi:hypothetical protein
MKLCSSVISGICGLKIPDLLTCYKTLLIFIPAVKHKPGAFQAATIEEKSVSGTEFKAL